MLTLSAWVACFTTSGKCWKAKASHVTLGVDFLKKHGIPELIVNCVAEHHEDKPFSSMESVIVHIADQISGADRAQDMRMVENYGKRLSEMEEIAKKNMKASKTPMLLKPEEN